MLDLVWDPSTRYRIERAMSHGRYSVKAILTLERALSMMRYIAVRIAISPGHMAMRTALAFRALLYLYSKILARRVPYSKAEKRYSTHSHI